MFARILHRPAFAIVVSLIILLLAGLAVMFRVREERAADIVD